MMMMITCTGRGANGDHCCYLGAEPCPHVVENQGGRRYACGLLLKYGSWEAVNSSSEYREVGEFWVEGDMPFNECELFSPIFCCRRDLNPGFNNEKEARAAGVIP